MQKKKILSASIIWGEQFERWSYQKKTAFLIQGCSIFMLLKVNFEIDMKKLQKWWIVQGYWNWSAHVAQHFWPQPEAVKVKNGEIALTDLSSRLYCYPNFLFSMSEKVSSFFKTLGSRRQRSWMWHLGARMASLAVFHAGRDSFVRKVAGKSAIKTIWRPSL